MFTYKATESKYLLPLSNRSISISGICDEHIDAPLPKIPWTYIDALYFAMATMSTVGYGDYTIRTDGAAETFVMVFTIFCALSTHARDDRRRAQSAAMIPCYATGRSALS